MRPRPVFFTMFALAVAALCGCADDDGDHAADGSPAAEAAPGPGGVLVLPSGLGLDLSKTATTQGQSGSEAESVAQAAGFGEETAQVVTLMLGPIAALQIPLDTSVTTYSGTAVFSKGTSLNVKIDFADYDQDGDGASDGCSGHTGALPICMRAWVEGERYLEGRVDTHPSGSAAGAGRFTLVKAEAVPGGEDGMALAVRYAHRSPEDRTTEIFWAMPNEEAGLGPWASIRHLLLEQTGIEAAAVKTVNLMDQMPPFPDASLGYLGRFREDKSLWFGSVQASGFFTQLGLKSFSASCIDLDTGQVVETKQCSDAGIAFDSSAYVAVGTDKDVAFSSGFSSTPSF